jgi:hypothetical protein
VKVMGEGDESDLNRSREEVHLEGEQSLSDGRTFTLVPMCVCGRGTNVRPCAPGEGANDHPRMGERSLPQCLQRFGEHFCERSPKNGRTFPSSVFSTLERVLVNDRPRMGECSLPQCV